MLLRRQHYIERPYLFALLFKRTGQQRVHCTNPVDVRMVLHLWLKGLHLSGQLCLGLHQIDLRQKLIAVEHFAYMRTYSFGHLRQYAYHFVTFVAFKLPDFVVGLYHFGWFDEHRASRCTFVVYNTVYLSFQCGRNRNY